MRALVTGATGFLGRAAAIRLACGMGWEVTGIGRNPEAGRALSERGIAYRQADLRHPEGIADACKGQDYVIHCAALSSPWGRYRDFHEANVVGTANVIAGCLRHGVRRLVHVSTPSVYFDYAHRLGLAESSPLAAKPANAYAATKRIAERLVTEAASPDFSAVILRPRAIFGPGDRSLFPRLLRVNERRGIPLVGGGEALLDLTFIEDAVDAIVLACRIRDDGMADGSADMREGDGTFAVFNISGGEPVRLIEALRHLFGLLGLPLRTRNVPLRAALAAGSAMEVAYRALPFLGPEPPFTRFTAGLLAYSQTFDIAQARKVLGYAPRVAVRDGLRQFAEWWKETHGR